jgi:hypothetical protein
VAIVHDDEQPRAAVPNFRRRSASGNGVASGRARRVQGRSMVACGGNHRNSGRDILCFGRRLRIGVAPGRRAEHSGGDRKRNLLFHPSPMREGCTFTAQGPVAAAAEGEETRRRAESRVGAPCNCFCSSRRRANHRTLLFFYDPETPDGRPRGRLLRCSVTQIPRRDNVTGPLPKTKVDDGR